MRKELKLFSSTPLLLAAMAFSLAACDQSDDVVDDPVAGVNEGIGGDRDGIGIDDGAIDDDVGAVDGGFGNDSVLGNDGAVADTDSGDVGDAQQTITEAVAVVNQMKQDTELGASLAEAQGVFIVPDYGQGAVLIGGEGGQGIAMLRQGEEAGSEWSAPAFYNFGGVTAGAQAGGEAGSVAMLLMTDEAVEMFRSEETDFSLDANAGLTIVNWSEKAEGSPGDADVIVWSDTEGLFAGANIAVTGINRDDDVTEAYYGEDVDTQQIFSGNITDDRSQTLRDALSS